MNISFLALSILFSHSNIHNTYAQDDVNQIDNESGNMDEVFQEREEFWTRELGDSMGKLLVKQIYFMESDSYLDYKLINIL